MTLPPLVQRYVERAVPRGGDPPGRVRLAQGGEMWQKPGGRALSFTAVEELAIGEVAFSRRARFRVAPLLSLRVHDWYRAGEGALEGAVLGPPGAALARARGDEERGHALPGGAPVGAPRDGREPGARVAGARRCHGRGGHRRRPLTYFRGRATGLELVD